MTNRKLHMLFHWHQGRWPWMTLNCYKFKFCRNFALLHIFRRLIYQGCRPLIFALARLSSFNDGTAYLLGYWPDSSLPSSAPLSHRLLSMTSHFRHQQQSLQRHTITSATKSIADGRSGAGRSPVQDVGQNAIWREIMALLISLVVPPRHPQQTRPERESCGCCSQAQKQRLNHDSWSLGASSTSRNWTTSVFDAARDNWPYLSSLLAADAAAEGQEI